MRTKSVVILFLCAVGAVSAARAQDEASVEKQSSIMRGEVARLDRDSIGEYGQVKRFQVSILWNEAEGKRPDEHHSRIVRYIADCKAGTLAVAAIGVYDNTGMLVKRMIVPPGASDPAAPEAGSQQAKWLGDVCTNP